MAEPKRPQGISLLVPTQNAELTVELCLRSFAAYPDEIIVVDNGSTDATKDIVRELEREYAQLRFFDCPDLADLHHNRQFALSKSRFAWIHRIDSDYVAYTDGENDIQGLRELVLATPLANLSTERPRAFRVRQFSLTRDFNTVGRDKADIPAGRGKYVQGGWSELAARIVQHFPGMEFARVNRRWEGIPGQEEFLSRTLDRGYWLHCDFKRPLDYLFRSERTNWREHGDFAAYPRLTDYLRAVAPEKYGTADLEEAAAIYMQREFDPWVQAYDPTSMPPYPRIVLDAAQGRQRLVSMPIIAEILPGQRGSEA